MYEREKEGEMDELARKYAGGCPLKSGRKISD